MATSKQYFSPFTTSPTGNLMMITWHGSLIALTIVLLIMFPLPSQSLNNDGFSAEAELMKGSHKGRVVQGLHKIKHYLQAYGYLQAAAAKTDVFDEQLEQAIKVYQLNYNLPVTGALDEGTVEMMLRPRCGVPDIIDGKTQMRAGTEGVLLDHRLGIGELNLTTASLYKYFYFPNGAKKKWPNGHRNLRYAIVGTPVFDQRVMRSAMASSFATWERVLQKFGFRFSEEFYQPGRASIILGFFPRDHGDGNPFGVYESAHAYPPTDGRCHFNQGRQWTIGRQWNRLDLLSIAIHEIGHLLGLDHSSFQDAIMWPILPTGVVKRNLTSDDIAGITNLYLHP